MSIFLTFCAYACIILILYIFTRLLMLSPTVFQSLDTKKKSEIIAEVSSLLAAYSSVASTVHTLITNNASLSDEYMNTFYSNIHQIMDDLQNNKINDAVKKLENIKVIIDKIHALEAQQSQENIESLIENI